jgi:uncharacterized membrane protein
MRTRWLAIVLGVSVALNLFFLGFMSARAFQRAEPHAERSAHAGRPPHVTPDGRQRRSWQRQRAFDWMTDAQRDELRPRRRALRGSRHAVADALRAEPFDRDKLGQALGDLRRQTDEIQASVHQFMLQRAASMTGEERRHLADSQWPSGDGRDGR